VVIAGAQQVEPHIRAREVIDRQMPRFEQQVNACAVCDCLAAEGDAHAARRSLEGDPVVRVGRKSGRWSFCHRHNSR
jgi:hypothetical protein